jgi:hypothetical protein
LGLVRRGREFVNGKWKGVVKGDEVCFREEEGEIRRLIGWIDMKKAWTPAFAGVTEWGMEETKKPRRGGGAFLVWPDFGS